MELSIIIKPDSPHDLAQGIEQASKNPSLSDRISLKSFKDIQKYSWANRVKKIINFI